MYETLRLLKRLIMNDMLLWIMTLTMKIFFHSLFFNVSTLNFMRGPCWGCKWLLKANSFKGGGFRKVTIGSLCFSWKFLVSGDVPICCSQENVKDKYELKFAVYQYITIHTIFIYFWLKIDNFLWNLFCASKCISILKFSI